MRETNTRQNGHSTNGKQTIDLSHIAPFRLRAGQTIRQQIQAIRARKLTLAGPEVLDHIRGLHHAEVPPHWRENLEAGESHGNIFVFSAKQIGPSLDGNGGPATLSGICISLRRGVVTEQVRNLAGRHGDKRQAFDIMVGGRMSDWDPDDRILVVRQNGNGGKTGNKNRNGTGTVRTGKK